MCTNFYIAGDSAMAQEDGVALSELNFELNNEDNVSVSSSGATIDSAYGSNSAGSQTSKTKIKKKVCFEADESLVRVFEIPYSYEEVPLPEELEPCNPLTLVDKFEDLTIQSVLTTKYGSYTLPNKQQYECNPLPTDTALEDINLTLKDISRNKTNDNVVSDVTTNRKHRKRDIFKMPHVPSKIEKCPDHSQRGLDQEKDPDDSVTSVSISKGPSCRRRKNDKVSCHTFLPEKPRRDRRSQKYQQSTQRKADKKLANIHDLLHNRSKSVGYHRRSNNIDGAGLYERKRPKSCSSLPTLHLSPYRRVTKTDFPVSAKSITFPDFISHNNPDLTGAKNESASWAKMSFISKDCSPPSERKASTSTASRKRYSWKVANGIIKPVDITTACISPMWENLTSKPSTAETNSVLSAL